MAYFGSLVKGQGLMSSLGLRSMHHSNISGRLLGTNKAQTNKRTRLDTLYPVLFTSRNAGSLAAPNYRSEGSNSDQNSEGYSRQWLAVVSALFGSVVAGYLTVNGASVKADDGKGSSNSKFFTIKDLRKKKESDPSADMVLYWASGSPPCWRVMIALEEKKLSNYQSKLLEMSKNEHKTEEVFTINPRGQVPTFKHGDAVVNESLAIVDYLETSFPSLGEQLLPSSPREKATVLQRKYEALNLFQKGLADYTFYTFRKPEDRDEKELEARLKSFREELDRWEKILKQVGPGNYAAGKDFSLADIALFPTLALLWRLGLNLDKYPSIKAYFDKVRGRESVQKTWPPHWTGDNKTILADV